MPLFVRWRPRLERLLGRWTNRSTDAEDLCQEVFLRIFRARQGYRPDAAFSTWLYRIALNVVRDGSRRRRMNWQTLDDQTSPAAAVEPSASPAANSSTPWPLPWRADEPLRRVLLLKQYGELTFAEVAAVTGLPASTVKSRVWLALEKLRGELRRRGLDETDLDL